MFEVQDSFRLSIVSMAIPHVSHVKAHTFACLYLEKPDGGVDSYA
jgi:hypothetical protein